MLREVGELLHEERCIVRADAQADEESPTDACAFLEEQLFLGVDDAVLIDLTDAHTKVEEDRPPDRIVACAPKAGAAFFAPKEAKEIDLSFELTFPEATFPKGRRYAATAIFLLFGLQQALFLLVLAASHKAQHACKGKLGFGVGAETLEVPLKHLSADGKAETYRSDRIIWDLEADLERRQKDLECFGGECGFGEVLGDQRFVEIIERPANIAVRHKSCLHPKVLVFSEKVEMAPLILFQPIVWAGPVGFPAFVVHLKQFEAATKGVSVGGASSKTDR